MTVRVLRRLPRKRLVQAAGVCGRWELQFHDFDVEVGILIAAVDTHPQGEVHFHGSRGGYIARSTADFHPNHSVKISWTLALVVRSFPLMNMSWSPGTSDGFTMTFQLTVLSVFTTLASGKAC
jgi:hypothetical protein